MAENILRVIGSTYQDEAKIQLRLDTKEGYTWYYLTLDQARALRKVLNEEIQNANLFARHRRAAYRELSALYQKRRAARG